MVEGKQGMHIVGCLVCLEDGSGRNGNDDRLRSHLGRCRVLPQKH